MKGGMECWIIMGADMCELDGRQVQMKMCLIFFKENKSCVLLKSLFVICVSLTPVHKHLHLSTPILWVWYPMCMRLLGCGYSLTLFLPLSKWFLLLMVGVFCLIDSLPAWASMCLFLGAAPTPCPVHSDSQLNIRLYANSCLPSIKNNDFLKKKAHTAPPTTKGHLPF